MIEEWRAVDGWPYEVSSLGRVRPVNWSRANPNRNPLKAFQNKDGYPRVRLCRDETTVTRSITVHTLVCIAWHGPKPFPAAQVRHLDGKIDHISPDNLCWGTSKENAADRDRHGTQAKGDQSLRAVLTNEIVAQLRQQYAALKEMAEEVGMERVPKGWFYKMARQYNVSRGALINIICADRGYKKN